MRLPQVVYLACSLIYSSISFGMNIPREQFPIENYTQQTHQYISPEQANYQQNLLTPKAQASRLKQFYQHYYASDANGLSPWSAALVNAVLPKIKKEEQGILNNFNQPGHYAENFKAHEKSWWPKLQKNANLDGLAHAVFHTNNRAIIINNTAARALPEAAPDFLDARIPGEGFPFDTLQVASLWVGTPVYVLNTSKDKAWLLVLTPDAYFAWVKSTDTAYASPSFIQQWQQAAKNKLAAITKTKVSVLDTEKNFEFSAYIGAVFPLITRNTQQTSILIPIKNAKHQAEIKQAVISSASIAPMPLRATPERMASMIQELQHRAYGWGGAFFLNDCSQEMKSLFTPFGIWLPRNSGMQQQLNPSMDLSRYTVDERLALLKTKGHGLMTLIYKKGHIMLYVGNKTINNQLEAITYQNIWGLSPENKAMRYVVGESVFLPMLKQFPENTAINSQANAPVFKMVYLDRLSKTEPSPQAFADSFS
jgi:cell wall-associated NlpC family hydrolase